TGSYPAFLANVNGALFFAASDGTHGVEPWVLPATGPAFSATFAPAATVYRAAAPANGLVLHEPTESASLPRATSNAPPENSSLPVKGRGATSLPLHLDTRRLLGVEDEAWLE